MASGFFWNRINSESIDHDVMNGPNEDHLGSKENFFVFITAEHTESEQNVYANLQSSFLIGKQHPEECFKFWFEYQVRKKETYI
jgi:hypothetical protein